MAKLTWVLKRKTGKKPAGTLEASERKEHELDKGQN